jgi:hypothetical protein
MCDASLIAYGIIAAAGTLYQGNEQAKATDAAYRAAHDEMDQRASDTRAAMQQVQELQSSQLSDRAMAAHREMAFLQTAAGEYGGGNTYNRLFNIADVNASRDVATINNNANRELTQLSRGNAADLVGYRSRLDMLRANAPSSVGSLLQIGGTALDLYGRYQAKQPPKSAPSGYAARDF